MQISVLPVTPVVNRLLKSYEPRGARGTRRTPYLEGGRTRDIA